MASESDPSPYAAAYGRKVPRNVVLSAEYDAADGIASKAGDRVGVAAPPANVEVDAVSLFVYLIKADGGVITERVYDHEFTPDV